MPIPALIIGLGGTGTLAATYIKKDLLENFNTWPLKEVRIVAFDTDNKAGQQAAVGGQGQLRKSGHTTGAVHLGDGEFFYVGGNVKRWMEECTRGQHPQLNTWLQSDWYLRNLPDTTFNLNEGAGQFRQFGRLAVFKDVATPAHSVIYNALRDALEKLRARNPTMKALEVFIVGSLAGGTGAGMFADVAHLVRKLSEQSNIAVDKIMKLRGYLVLPNAFSREVDSSVLTSMHGRAYAAMRENSRFTVNFDFDRGYPMRYHEGDGNPVWHGAMRGRLFDMIYYVDGGTGAISLRNTVTPAIADTICASIDGFSGTMFSSHLANVEAERSHRIQRGVLSEKTPTYGGLSSYTFVFPIFHIMESWAHDLGLETLNQLLAPDEFDAQSGLPTHLSSNSNRENEGATGFEAGQKFLRAITPVSYEYRDEGGNLRTEVIEPTLLPGELARIAGEASKPASGIIGSLTGRDIGDWNQTFIPTGGDRQTLALLQRVEAILRTRLYDKDGPAGEVKASDQKKPQKGDPAADCDGILTEVMAFKNRYLGSEDPRTGQRSAGQYRTSLAQVVEHHVERFIRSLDLQVQAILNGSPNHTSSDAKGGKLGFLVEFLAGLKSDLTVSQETLKRVVQNRREKGAQRRTALAEAATGSQNMRSSAAKKGMFNRPAREAFDDQHTYLEAESRLVDILKVEATEEAILDVVNRMIDYVISADKAVQQWVTSLACSKNSLHDLLTRGRKLVDSDRYAANQVLVRKVIEDKQYEKKRYDYYVNLAPGGSVNQILASLEWRLERNMAAGRPKVGLNLVMHVDEDRQAGRMSNQIKLDDAEEIMLLWLKTCRRPFAAALGSESVLAYLRQNSVYKDPTNLAAVIHENSALQLNIEGGNPLPANYVRAYFQTEEEAGDHAYLRQVIQSLATKKGISTFENLEATDKDKEGAKEEIRAADFASSDDRFKLTLVFFQDLIELDKITSYVTSGRQAYMGSTGAERGDRRLLQIFPAEVHAAFYEDRLRKDLGQIVRQFSDKVTLQLEDLHMFRLFLFCYTYKMIHRIGLKDTGGNQRNVFRLVVPPEKEFDEYGRESQPEEYWLSDPQKAPLILDALATFNFSGKDTFAFQGTDSQGKRIDRGQNYVKVINYTQVVKALGRIRQEDAQRRLAEGSAGKNSQDLLAMLDTVDAATRSEVLDELARLDRLREVQDDLKERVIPSYQNYLSNPDNQNDYDVAAVFALMTMDEVKKTRQVIYDRLTAVRGTGVRLPSTPTGGDDRVDAF